jgi:D-arabinose 1-dehydrogenase-like Zn-dependent alcohol dehydrogenase
VKRELGVKRAAQRRQADPRRLFGGEIRLSIASTILRAITIQGSHLGSVEELKSVVALARDGKLKPIPIETRALAEVSRTLDELKAGSVVGRMVARFDHEHDRYRDCPSQM